MAKVRVLFVAANPSQDLRLDEEIRQITQNIRAAEHRDALQLLPCFAVRPDDLQQALLEHQPHILHFSGHGSPSDEIILLDDDSKPQPVSAEALVRLLRALKDNLRIVVLNACYSRSQAKAISQIVDFAIGMRAAIGDEAAIKFAASFYRGLSFGKSVQTSFELGTSALMLHNIPEETTPELVVRDGQDSSAVVMVSGTGSQEVQASRVPFRVSCPDLSPWNFDLHAADKRKDFSGRAWLFNEIGDWLQQSNEPALLITGDPGTGKTSLVAELIHQNRNKRVLAYHFCQADTQDTLNPACMIRSLAAMIASRLEGYRLLLDDPNMREALTDAACQEDPGSAFERALLAPLASIRYPDGGPHYIVVDALDESLCWNRVGQTILEVLAPRIDRFPLGFG